MAVKTITSANVAHRNTEEITGTRAETAQNPVFISHPSPLYYLLGPVTHLIPIAGRALQELITGETFTVGLPTMLILERIQDLFDRFVNKAANQGPASTSVMSAVTSLVAKTIRPPGRQCKT